MRRRSYSCPLALIGWICIFGHAARAEDSQVKIVDRVFPPPHLLMGESLFRVSPSGDDVFLQNSSDTRGIKNAATSDRHWKLDTSVYRGLFAAQPWSDQSTEFWIRTAQRPKRGEFDNDSVMLAQSIVQFHRKDQTQLRVIDFEQGIFLLCKENNLDHPRKNFPQEPPNPLSCLAVDREFCQRAIRPLRKEELYDFLSQAKKSDGTPNTIVARSSTALNTHVLQNWSDTDETFRGNLTTVPTVEPLKKIELFTAAEITVTDQACDLLLRSPHAKKAKQHAN